MAGSRELLQAQVGRHNCRIWFSYMQRFWTLMMNASGSPSQLLHQIACIEVPEF
jgi:hypothetical protein